MATKRGRGVWRPGIPRGNPPPGNLGDVCAIFTRDEIAGWFREWEATLVETMNNAIERAKRARAAEWPLPPEDEGQSDETAAMSTSSPQGAQAMDAATPAALTTEEAPLDKASR